MPNSDINLNFFTKYYKIFGNQSIVVWDIKSPEDANFQYRLRFIENGTKKTDFNQLENKLRNFIEKVTYSKKLFLNKKYEFLISLKELDLDLKSTQLIQKKKNKNIVFKVGKDQSKVIQEFDKNLSALFITDTFQNTSKILNFGYEMPDVIIEDATPLYYVSIYSDKQLAKKLYLFPISARSLENTVSMLKNNSVIALQSLGIPYVEYIPKNSTSNSNYDKDIQTRINLQTIISEILTHLEKPKCFRKNGSEKADIFRNLAKSIANGEALGNISSKLNEHDTWKLLAQHRDPWGFLSFFKGKTHSLIAWKALKDETSNFFSSSLTSTPSK